MTLLVRNSFLRAGIIIALLSLAIVAVSGYFAFPAFPEAAASAAFRSGGIIQELIDTYTEPRYYVPFFAMVSAVVYSLVSIILILYYFEKTQSPEILFFACFVISLSLEFVRIIIPMKWIISFPDMYMITASRILLFSRFFGVFSLFAAGAYAAGLDEQKQQNAFFILIIASMIIAMNVPVDSLVWDSSLKMQYGYGSMLLTVEIGIVLVTVVTFFISAYTRGSKTFRSIGMGIFLAFVGRNFLLVSDTWLTFIPGLLFLAFGTWYTCTQLHREYLWL